MRALNPVLKHDAMLAITKFSSKNHSDNDLITHQDSFSHLWSSITEYPHWYFNLEQLESLSE